MKFKKILIVFLLILLFSAFLIILPLEKNDADKRNFKPWEAEGLNSIWAEPQNLKGAEPLNSESKEKQIL
ncbi:MAG: hypothetical protein PHD41_03880, partial [Methanosarcinaceae archaeon]|nr:hypothetical protein [Methanosarcinaceae archaeon]